jgi:hypothetical protein
MNRQENLKVTLSLVILALLTLTGCVKSKNHQHGRRQRPPVEAIQACEGKQAGNRVEFTGRNGEIIEASCQEINGQLVAVPDGMLHEGDQPKRSEEK